MAHAFVLIMAVMVFVNVLVYVCMHPILWFLRVPQEVMEEMQQYLVIIYAGLRVVLAYILSVPLKAPGIWVAIVNHKNLKEI